MSKKTNAVEYSYPKTKTEIGTRIVNEVNQLRERVQCGDDDAINDLCLTLGKVTLCMVEASGCVDKRIIQEIALCARSLTSRLCDVTSTKQGIELVEDVARRSHDWPVLVHKGPGVEERIKKNLAGIPLGEYSPMMPAKMNLNPDSGWNSFLDVALLGILIVPNPVSECEFEFTKKMPPLNSIKAVTIWTDYILSMVDCLMGGTEWQAEDFRAKFPVKECLNYLTHSDYTVDNKSLRALFRRELRKKLVQRMEKVRGTRE